MTDRYYLTDGAHVLIAGSTGAGERFGGKTTTANWWLDKSVKHGWHDWAVFISPKRNPSFPGSSVSSLSGLADSYRSGQRRIFYHLTGGVEEHEAVVETMRQIGGSGIIGHDEAQAYKGSEMLSWCLSQGGNLPTGSIRSLVLTQRPWNLSEELRANMPLKVWVGPVTSEGRKFFKVEEMGEAQRQVEADMKPYHWAVTDAGEYLHTNPPVPGEYA